MSRIISKEQIQCAVLEIEYLKQQGKEVKGDYQEIMSEFPGVWVLNSNYDLKAIVLKEAIEKKIKLQETESYLKYFEEKVEF